MIPSSSELLSLDLTVEEQPTQTYAMELDSDRVRGYTDGIEAMKQAVFKILNTERYQYVMYSWNYGIELADLFGMPKSYVVPELERRITEALTWDDRIDDVTDFTFDTSKRGVVYTTFTVQTIFGAVDGDLEVNF